MKIARYGHYFVARLEKGEEIVASLTAAAQRKSLSSAFFFGLGVARDPVLGYFDAHTKSYVKKAFAGEFEFTSFSGNISRKGKKPAIHCHVTITDEQFSAFGGHLFHATVPATMEIMLIPVTPGLARRRDNDTGLYLLDVR